ncbi:hypothetical protein OsJ_24350 [Oryza sativa Japonica Group]|uniref:Uncharacterized protein n=1 Tax=Oryza sativa subsp. japonica TaxID=39947 RepID=A3BK21_ORYSJ|nr:hypothetical protein OsJ_24350 [Oryza sativa Japonica Group]
MARNTVFRFQVTNAGEEEEPEERQIAVDPFSLRQFSRLDIDGPLPIPSVSVDHHHHHAPHARPGPALVLAGASASVPTSPRRVSAWDAPPTRWDAHLAVVAAAPAARVASSDVMAPPRTAISRSRSCAGAAEADLDDDEFDVILSSSERKAIAPQRVGHRRASHRCGRRRRGLEGLSRRGSPAAKRAAPKWKRGGGAAPFTCCLYLPGARHQEDGQAFTTQTPRRAHRRCRRHRQRSVAAAAAAAWSPTQARRGRAPCRWPCRSSGSTAARAQRRPGSGLALDGEAGSSYFDLPLELILGCDGDDEADLPVHAAFMFDSDGIRKSVLKKGVRRAAAAAARPSVGKMSTDGPDRISGRHVRFYVTSGSSPTSTPAVVSVLAGER